MFCSKSVKALLGGTVGHSVVTVLKHFRLIRYVIQKHSGAQGIQYVRLVLGYAKIYRINVSQDLVVFVSLFSFRVKGYGIRKHSSAQGI